MANSYVDNWKLNYGNSKKLDGNTYYLISDPITNPLKYVLDDITFINPPLKGYYLPKTNNLAIGKSVIIKGHKVSSYNYGYPLLKGEVISIKRNQSSKRLKNSECHRKDHVTIRLTNRQVISAYAEDLKLDDEAKKSTELF